MHSMLRFSIFSAPLDHPKSTLIVLFFLWKTFLLLVVAYSPGPGWDTSTYLLHPDTDGTANQLLPGLSLITKKLTRWDGIWFTTIAQRSYLFEQDWAFGWGFTRILAFFANALESQGAHHDFLETVVGSVVAHFSHGLSVIVLYHLARDLFRGSSGQRVAFVASCLYILSPAGIFLSAPYAESTFALLSFTGVFLFIKSFPDTGIPSTRQDLCLFISGIFLGLATTLRSNGLASGLYFMEEALRTLYSIRQRLYLSTIRRLAAVGAGGLCIAAGSIVPQYLAYKQFCGNTSETMPTREWCGKLVPSIYTFVQDRYWEVGFLRYWEPPNIPLYLIATPMIILMTFSSFRAVEKGYVKIPEYYDSVTDASRRKDYLLRCLAIPEGILALMAVTNYHVQIITRISSGYPVWYLWLATTIIDPDETKSLAGDPPTKQVFWSKRGFGGEKVLRFLMVYAVVQAGLYAAFLPPA